MNSRYLFKAKKKNWQELLEDDINTYVSIPAVSNVLRVWQQTEHIHVTIRQL